MRKGILILACLLLAAPLASSQHKRQKLRPKVVRKTPCWETIPAFDEWTEERKIEWRAVGKSDSADVFYNTRKITCENGILKAWIKYVDRDISKDLSYQIVRYEINCRSNQTRIISGTDYDIRGDVLKVREYSDSKWSDPVPDSVAEGILEKVCRKKI